MGHRRDEIDGAPVLRKAAAQLEERRAGRLERRAQRGQLVGRILAAEGISDLLIALRKADRILAQGQQQRRHIVSFAKRLQLDAERHEAGVDKCTDVQRQRPHARWRGHFEDDEEARRWRILVGGSNFSRFKIPLSHFRARARAAHREQPVIKSQEAAKQNSVDSAEIPNSREQITMPALLRPNRIQPATKFHSGHPKGAAGESKRP